MLGLGLPGSDESMITSSPALGPRRNSLVSSVGFSDPIVAFYEHKTAGIIERYGPGPRIHYHTGLVNDLKPLTTISEIQIQLVAAQERLLRYAAEAWGFRTGAPRDLLDVGCGLGGGAIFWAQEFAANVTALTIAPSHIELVAKFARQAGVGSRVHPELGDALEFPGENRFDSAAAIDSSSSFPRPQWFRRLAKLLRPAGQVFIVDCFLGRTEYEQPFNRHWCARIGSIDEYIGVARNAGFRLNMIEDLSLRALPFWTATIALIQKEAQKRTLCSRSTTEVEESLRVHSLVRQGLSDGGLRHMLMSFVKK